MGSKFIIEISANSITICPIRVRKARHKSCEIVRLPFCGDFTQDCPQDIDAIMAAQQHLRGADIVMVANLRRTAIRMCDVAHTADAKDFRVRRIPAHYFERSYCFMDGFNFDTHIFDGNVFQGASDAGRLFMAALPREYCASIARIGAACGGYVRGIEVLEHLLLRSWQARSASGEWLIFLPQEQGLRVLVMAYGLPMAAGYISAAPQYGQAEMARFMRTVHPGIASWQHPQAVVASFAGADNAADAYDWIFDWLRMHGIRSSVKACDLTELGRLAFS